MPRLGHEQLGDTGQHDLGDLDAEGVAVRYRPAGDLRLARPPTRVVRRWIDSRAVHCKPGIPAQVVPLDRAGHRTEPQFPPSKLSSMPLIRGEPSERTVAIVLCLRAPNSPRTRCANSGASRATSA